MKVIDIYNSLKDSGKKGFSIEILPPVKGTSLDDIEKSLLPIIPLNPQFINITFHAPVRKFINENNVTTLVESHPRTATAAVAGALKRRTGIEVVPHLTSAAYTKLQLEDFVIDFSYEDLDNIFVIRSDKDPLDSRFRVNPFGHANAAGLVEQIKNLSKGIYHDKFVKEPRPIDFCIGVAAYPEKHQEANTLDEDIEYLKQKVDKGASYIVTQMFFDNSKFYSFIDRCNKFGIDVPVIPALKPLSLASHLISLPSTFSIEMPDELRHSVEAATDDKEAVKKIGMEWCLRQSEDLLKQGFPLIHYFTMGRMNDLSKNLTQIF